MLHHPSIIEESSSSSLPPQNFAILIHLISDKIFTRLDFSDLTSLRLVSHSWSFAASLNLLQKCSSLSFQLKPSSSNESLLFAKLVSLLHSRTLIFPSSSSSLSPPFPCTKFCLSGNLDSPLVSSFLHLHGHLITNLKLIHEGDKMIATKIIPQFLLLTPKITKLTLYNSDLQISNTNEEDDFSLSFPHLYKFSSYCLSSSSSPTVLHSSLAFKILQGSPNLTCARGFALYNLPLFKLANKIHLLHKIRLPSPIHMDKIRDFVTLRPHLTNLTICFDDTVLIQSEVSQLCMEISKLLELSKNSLEKLTLQPLPIFEGIIYPSKFTRLRKLTVNAHNIVVYDKDEQRQKDLVPGKVFPGAGISLEKIFPRLTILNLNLRDFSRQAIMKYFPMEGEEPQQNVKGKFGSVTHLEITIGRRCPLSKFALEWLKDMCPRLKGFKLNIHSFQLESLELEEIFRIWSGGDLEELEFKVSCNVDREFYMDSLLTGIEPGICAKLRCTQGKSGEEIEGMRTKFSICDMRKLRELKITRMSNGVSRRAVSRVSQLYAFDLMKDLRVTIK